jgi:hypothetical protein
MRKIAAVCGFLLFVLALPPNTFGQDTPKSQTEPKAQSVPVHYYRVEFVIQELGMDGKIVNSRAYKSTVATDPRNTPFASIRSTSRIPVAVGSTRADASGAAVPSQYEFHDVGISIDVRDAHDVNGQLALYLVADINSLASPSRPTNLTIRSCGRRSSAKTSGKQLL